MSEAKDKYYAHEKYINQLSPYPSNYIFELEQQNKELIEFACDNCVGLCYYDECKIYKYKQES